MPLNKPLLRKIARFIRKHPSAHRQGVSFAKGKRFDFVRSDHIPRATMKDGCPDHCGCLFGLAIALTPKGKRPEDGEVFMMGKKLLGIRSMRRALGLFSSSAHHTPESLERMAR